MATMTTRLADKLNGALSACGLSKYQLAKNTGVSEGMISRYFSGARVPSDETIARLAPALGLDPVALIDIALADRLGADAVDRVSVFSRTPISNANPGDLDNSSLDSRQAAGISSESPTHKGVVAFALRGVPEVKMPYAGRAGCGRRIELEEGATFDVLPSIAEQGDFCVHAVGDSMTKAGIKDGDLLIVRATDTPEDNQVVLVTFSYDGSSVKRYRVGQAPNSGSFLVTESHTEDAPPILVDASVHINGVVVYVQPAGFAL